MTLTDRLLALTGVIPPFLLLWAAERFERRIREPAAEWRYRVLAAAGLASVPIAWLERLLSLPKRTLPEPSHTLFEAFVEAAAVEEAGKVGCLWLLTRGLLGPRTRYGAFLYAVHASLGFALVENVIAMLTAPDLLAFTTRFVLRAYLTIPMHMVAGGTVGYLWARQRFEAGSIGLAGGFGIAVLIHGTYDALLLAVERLPQGHPALTAAAAGAIAIPLVGTALLAMGARRLRDADRRQGRPALSQAGDGA